MTKVEDQKVECALYRKTVDELESTVYDKDKGLVEQVSSIKIDMGTIKFTTKIILGMNSALLVAMIKVVFFGK